MSKSERWGVAECTCAFPSTEAPSWPTQNWTEKRHSVSKTKHPPPPPPNQNQCTFHIMKRKMLRKNMGKLLRDQNTTHMGFSMWPRYYHDLNWTDDTFCTQSLSLFQKQKYTQKSGGTSEGCSKCVTLSHRISLKQSLSSIRGILRSA